MQARIRHVFFRAGPLEFVEYETGEYGILRDGLPVTHERWTVEKLEAGIAEFQRRAAQETQSAKVTQRTK